MNISVGEQTELIIWTVGPFPDLITTLKLNSIYFFNQAKLTFVPQVLDILVATKIPIKREMPLNRQRSLLPASQYFRWAVTGQ